MKRKRKTHHRAKTRVRYLPSINDGLGEIGALSFNQFEPSIYGAVTGIAAAFLDNMLNIDPKIKGAGMIIGSALLPMPDAVKGAIAGKGGEIIAKSTGIISDELDGFIAVSDEEISEIADAISDEVINDDLSDEEVSEVINDDIIQDAIYEEVQI